VKEIKKKEGWGVVSRGPTRVVKWVRKHKKTERGGKKNRGKKLLWGGVNTSGRKKS